MLNKTYLTTLGFTGAKGSSFIFRKDKHMNSTIKALLGMAGVLISAAGITAAAVEYRNAKSDAVGEELARIKCKREDSDWGYFQQLSSLKADVRDILNAEEMENRQIESAIKVELEEAKDKCKHIFNREKAAFDRERADISKKLDEAKAVKAAVKDREKSQLETKMRYDNTYISLEKAKKAYDNITDGDSAEMKEKIASKLKARKEELEREVKKSRSKYEKGMFDAAAKLKDDLDNFDRTRMKEIISERTPEELELIHKYDKVRGELNNKSARMDAIQSKRTPEQLKAFQDLELIQERVADVVARENAKLDAKTAWAHYLSKRGIPKWLVAGVAFIPMIPVAFLGVLYWRWVFDFINKMEVV